MVPLHPPEAFNLQRKENINDTKHNNQTDENHQVRLIFVYIIVIKLGLAPSPLAAADEYVAA